MADRDDPSEDRNLERIRVLEDVLSAVGRADPHACKGVSLCSCGPVCAVLVARRLLREAQARKYVWIGDETGVETKEA